MSAARIAYRQSMTDRKSVASLSSGFSLSYNSNIGTGLSLSSLSALGINTKMLSLYNRVEIHGSFHLLQTKIKSIIAQGCPIVNPLVRDKDITKLQRTISMRERLASSVTRNDLIAAAIYRITRSLMAQRHLAEQVNNAAAS